MSIFYLRKFLKKIKYCFNIFPCKLISSASLSIIIQLGMNVKKNPDTLNVSVKFIGDYYNPKFKLNLMSQKISADKYLFSY
jgi:hypothetical protein